MADGNTPTYNLILPEIDGADGTWGISLNSNLGSLDSLLSGGTALSAITVTGTVTAGGVSLANDKRITLGAEAGTNYLEIFESTAGNGVIKQVGAGDFAIQGHAIQIKDDDGNLRFQGTNGSLGNAFLYYGADTTPKLNTVSTGINVTGGVAADYIDLTGGKTTTTTGEIAADKILFSAHLNDTAKIFAEVGGVNNDITSLVLDMQDDGHELIEHRIDGTTRLTVKNAGIDVTGIVDCDGLKMDDGEYAQFGTANDLKIWHSGINSYIQESGAGQLILNTTNGGGIYIESAGETMAQFVSNGTVNLYHDNEHKFATTATGIDVTGTVTADGLTLGAGEIATFNSGDGGNLQISGSATGSFSLIKQTAVGDLFIQAQNGHLRNDANESLVAWDGFKAELYWRGASGAGAKLATTAAGIDVTGTVEADGFIGDSISSAGTEVVFNDNIKLANSATKILGNDDITLRPAATKETNLETSAGVPRVQVTDTLVRLYYGTNLNTTASKLETSAAGVDVIGDLDVTGTITSNAFAYSKATVNNAADILYTAFNSFAGKRIINTASATNTTYGLPTPVAADIGKSWIICNPTDSLITIDHDASGTANYIWIMDGVTLSAAASSWTIKRGAVVEIVVAAAAAGGGSSTAPNYLIFGAGLLEI